MSDLTKLSHGEGLMRQFVEAFESDTGVRLYPRDVGEPIAKGELPLYNVTPVCAPDGPRMVIAGVREFGGYELDEGRKCPIRKSSVNVAVGPDDPLVRLAIDAYGSPKPISAELKGLIFRLFEQGSRRERGVEHNERLVCLLAQRFLDRPAPDEIDRLLSCATEDGVLLFPLSAQRDFASCLGTAREHIPCQALQELPAPNEIACVPTESGPLAARVLSPEGVDLYFLVIGDVSKQLLPGKYDLQVDDPCGVVAGLARVWQSNCSRRQGLSSDEYESYARRRDYYQRRNIRSLIFEQVEGAAQAEDRRLAEFGVLCELLASTHDAEARRLVEFGVVCELLASTQDVDPDRAKTFILTLYVVDGLLCSVRNDRFDRERWQRVLRGFGLSVGGRCCDLVDYRDAIIDTAGTLAFPAVREGMADIQTCGIRFD